MASDEIQDLVEVTKKQLLHLQSLGVEGIQLGEVQVTRRQPASIPPRVVEPPKPTVKVEPPAKPSSINIDSLFGNVAPPTETSATSTETFDDIQNDIGNCTRCSLHLGRTNICH